MPIGVSHPSPHALDKTIVFIDGTNLFCKLNDSQLIPLDLQRMVNESCRGRRLLHAYLYTTEEKYIARKKDWGDTAFASFKPIFGDSISTNGEPREKGVDALLVADLVYHAAMKNCQHIVVFSNDSDFRFAIKRAEDFGCTTGLVSVIKTATDRLKMSCDEYTFFSESDLISKNICKKK
jgi:uncharacterized LabA/DUF88 family protein